MTETIDHLRWYLDQQAPGLVDAAPLTALLMEAWVDLGGEDVESTFARKLPRLEEPTWEPPVLRFRLERHGAKVLGSTRSAVHYWQVDLDARSASIVSTAHRQTDPTAARLDAATLAAEIADIIESGDEDPRVKWNGEEVQVVAGVAVPATNKQTTTARRKRFRAAIDAEMSRRGWGPGGGIYRYRRLLDAQP